MTTNTPASGNDPGLPSLHTLHFDVLRLRGLVEAMGNLAHLIGPNGLPLDAVICSAMPLASDIEQRLSLLKDAAK